MNSLLIYTPHTSSRLKYTLDWLFTEQFGLNYELTHDASQEVPIAYGAIVPGAINIPDRGLLWQQSVTPHAISTGSWKDIPILYHSTEEKMSLPFDIFSAIFFILSRYEEYYSFIPDKHDRYPATQSVLFKFLEQPVVDEWIAKFAELLKEKNIAVQQKEFLYTPTYDIDIAWSYKNKGLQRNLGGLAVDILNGNISEVAQRLSALFGSNDPYDSFDWIDVMHDQHNLSPIYFMLVAERTSQFDKNIAPSTPPMRALIKRLSDKYCVGIHPSYYSNVRPSLITNEKILLENITAKKITQSRQHYIKFKLPDTYRELIRNDITDDYSMGYATHIGFRAGTGRSFLWFDLMAENISPLRIHPFCFMDTTARFDMGLDAVTAKVRLEKMKELLKNTNSTLITVFHNFSLGTDAGWAGWKNTYKQFISGI